MALDATSSASSTLLKELDNAAEHYRHLENLRARHLGFLFTAAFGAVAYIGTFHEALSHAWQTVAIAGITILVTILACFTYISVRKFGVALTYNQDLVKRIRAELLAGASESERMVFHRTPNMPASRFLRSKLFTVQGTAEFTCVLAGLASAGANVALAAYFLVNAASAGVRVALVALAVSGAFLVAGVISVGDRPYWVGS